MCLFDVSLSLDELLRECGVREHSVSMEDLRFPRPETVDLPLCPKLMPLLTSSASIGQASSSLTASLVAAWQMFLASHLQYSLPSPSHSTNNLSLSADSISGKACATAESILPPATNEDNSCQMAGR